MVQKMLLYHRFDFSSAYFQDFPLDSQHLKVEMIFGVFEFFQKTNKQILLTNVTTCFCSFFERNQRHQKSFWNYLTFIIWCKFFDQIFFPSISKYFVCFEYICLFSQSVHLAYLIIVILMMIFATIHIEIFQTLRVCM